jgi:hypothetical protein
MSTASLIEKIYGESLSVVDSTHCINKAILCQRINDVDHISKEVLETVDGQMKTYLHHYSVDSEDEGHFPVEFRVASDILVFLLIS